MTDEVEEKRRGEDRRIDPDAWTAAHRKQVKFIYGLVVGGILILGGIAGLIVNAMRGPVTMMALVGSGAFILLGLVASMPSVFMPVLSAVLKKVPWGKANGALPTINEEDAE